MPQLIKLETQQDMVYTPKEGYVTKVLSKDADGNIVQIIKNSDGDFVQIKGGSGSSSVTSATHKDVSSQDLVNGYIVVDGDSLPVAVQLNDIIYSVSQCPIIRQQGSLKMLSSYFLAKAKLQEYTGVYKIWLATGQKGQKGERGEKGEKGEDGAVSFDELTATQIQMLKGEKGDKGDKGDTGEQGPKGDKGDTGQAGPKGDTGEQGPKGDKGDTGEQGPKGDRGDSFNVDETGPLSQLATHKDKPKGFSFLDIQNGNVYIKNSDAQSDWSEPLPFKGPKGDTGDTGPKGDKGDKGDTGEQGPKGDKGDTGQTGPKGDTGEQGPKGDKGDVGEQGPKGDKGDTGEQGPKGDRGDSFNVDETGPLSQLATHKDKPKGFSFLDIQNGNIYIKNSDAQSDWSQPLPFKGPKGDTGEQGPKGDKGDTGEQGPKGDTGEQGPKGDTGEQGPKGDRGDSFNVDETGPLSQLVTYKDRPKGFSFLDIQNGNIYIKNSDDQSDWSEPLPFKGPKGDTGDTGPKGDTGQKGQDGIIYNSKMVVNQTVIFQDKQYIQVSVNLIPVAVQIQNKLYYINDLIIQKKNNKVLIPVQYLLTKASISEFTAGWIVYFSGGVPGEKGLKGDPGKNGINYKVQICTVLPQNPDPETMYLIVQSV